MILTPKHLTEAMECPARLYFALRPEFHAPQENDDFGLELIKMSAMFRALALLLFPDGRHLRRDESLGEVLATHENITLFDVRLSNGKIKSRVHVLEKTGLNIRLYEVRAKKVPDLKARVFGKRGDILQSGADLLMRPGVSRYLMDEQFPDYRVESWYCAVGEQPVGIDGMGRVFFVDEHKGHVEIKIQGDPLPIDEVRNLVAISPMDSFLPDFIRKEQKCLRGRSLEELIAWAVEIANKEDPEWTTPGKQCSGCTYRQVGATKSGFEQCWSKHFPNTPIRWNGDLTVYDLYGGYKSGIEPGTLYVDELTETVTKPTSTLTHTGIRYLQQQGLGFFAEETLERQMADWNWPLRMIDFETIGPAIPMFKGMRPYENLAFQFSMHAVWPEGRLAHIGEWIGAEPGKFPSFDFVRVLKQQLDSGQGDVMHFHYHEVKVLKDIGAALPGSDESDKHELAEWISDLIHGKLAYKLIDLAKVAEKVWFGQGMRGFSAKDILPALLTEGELLRDRFSKPVYGSEAYPSLNFEHFTLVRKKEHGWCSPYELLPTIVDEEIRLKLGHWLPCEGIKEGGLAMAAWHSLQLQGFPEELRRPTEKALRRYCEMDTLTMAMLMMHWLDRMGAPAS